MPHQKIYPAQDNSSFASSIAEIDLSALAENIRRVRTTIGDCEILAVVKANAYGHGALEIARFLAQNTIKPLLFGVAFLEEAIALREGGITDRILLLTGVPLEQVEAIIQYRLSPVIYDLPSLEALRRAAEAAGAVVPVHIKIDTGMGRIGLPPDTALSFIKKAVGLAGIRVEGILSHFAHADLKDSAFTQQQLASLQTILSELEAEGILIPYCHLANSAAIIQFREACFNLVRPGLMLYGYSPMGKRQAFGLKPVMRVKTRVLAVKKVAAGQSISYGQSYVTKRESLIATVAIGYADGYDFRLSNRGEMIALGQRVPVVGRVCMDMTMLDVSKVPTLAAGDWVTVIGSEGSESIWADELARWTGSHAYEILCGIGNRVKRQYIKQGKYPHSV